MRSTSELVGITGLLGGADYIVERAPGGCGDGGGDGAVDDRGVDQLHVPVGLRRENVADREDRAAEVGEDRDAGALVGAPDRVADACLVGAEPAGGGAAGRLDAHVGAG